MENRDNFDRLMLVFVHGFRGTDASFKDFPNRLQTILTNTVKADVSAIVYPSYKTAGELKVAVENFSNWLISEVYKTKEAMQRLNCTGNIMIVLLGHSMGGIVSAETILKFHGNKSNNHDQLLGAKIVGMLAFDTPFYSISQKFLVDQAQTGIEQVKGFSSLWNTGATTLTAATATRAIANTSNTTTSTGGAKKWGLLAGIVGVAAVGAAAYIAREKIQETVTSAIDELAFISDLTDMHSCEQRVRELIEIPDMLFRCFYVQLSALDKYGNPKTFINAPPEDVSYLFIPVPSPADTEVRAHTSMFNPNKTDHYYELGRDSVSLISEMVARFQRRRSRTNY